MQLSVDRILATHVGSLPRPPPLVDLLIRKDRGEDHDEQAFDVALTGAVADVVARQVSLGIDIVSDGEFGKMRYSTYITDRLSGFEGDSPRKAPLDLKDFPDLSVKMARVTGAQAFRRCSCVGPVALTDREPLRRDLANFEAAISKAAPIEAFMNAPRPASSRRSSPTRSIRPTPTTLRRSPTPCRRSTRPSSPPDSCSRSTVPISPWPVIPASRT